MSEPVALNLSSARARVAVVVNGNAKSVNEDVISSIDQILRGGDLFVSRHIDEAPEIARIIVDRGYGTVLTGGGDGTFTVMVTEVARAAKDAGQELPRFGLLKLGTGNALAWVVGASPLGGKNVKADIERLHQEAGSKKVHLVDVEGFLSPFAGVGADAQILADYNKNKKMLSGTPFSPLGKGLSGYSMATLTRTLPAFVFKKMPEIRVINDGEDVWPVDPNGLDLARPIKKGEVIYEGKARLAALSTIPYYGFGMRLFPFSDAHPDRMNLRISTMGSPQFVSNFRGIWNGTYHQPKYLKDFAVDRIVIEMKEPTELQIGGDSQGLRSQIEASVTRRPIDLVDFYTNPEED